MSKYSLLIFLEVKRKESFHRRKSSLEYNYSKFHQSHMLYFLLIVG